MFDQTFTEDNANNNWVLSAQLNHSFRYVGRKHLFTEATLIL